MLGIAIDVACNSHQVRPHARYCSSSLAALFSAGPKRRSTDVIRGCAPELSNRFRLTAEDSVPAPTRHSPSCQHAASVPAIRGQYPASGAAYTAAFVPAASAPPRRHHLRSRRQYNAPAMAVLSQLRCPASHRAHSGRTEAGQRDCGPCQASQQASREPPSVKVQPYSQLGCFG